MNIGYYTSYMYAGNAMGYIRMIRSGGLHCCSNAIRSVNAIAQCLLKQLLKMM